MSTLLYMILILCITSSAASVYTLWRHLEEDDPDEFIKEGVVLLTIILITKGVAIAIVWCLDLQISLLSIAR
jgi:hypothetical protein